MRAGGIKCVCVCVWSVCRQSFIMLYTPHSPKYMKAVAQDESSFFCSAFQISFLFFLSPPKHHRLCDEKVHTEKVQSLCVWIQLQGRTGIVKEFCLRNYISIFYNYTKLFKHFQYSSCWETTEQNKTTLTCSTLTIWWLKVDFDCIFRSIRLEQVRYVLHLLI